MCMFDIYLHVCIYIHNFLCLNIYKYTCMIMYTVDVYIYSIPLCVECVLYLRVW